MAQIFDFPASQSRASSNAHTMSGIAGEVVLFPGVRYDRIEEDAAPSKAKKRPGARRDLLELED
jgi:hypothetical protein